MILKAQKEKKVKRLFSKIFLELFEKCVENVLLIR